MKAAAFWADRFLSFPPSFRFFLLSLFAIESHFLRVDLDPFLPRKRFISPIGIKNLTFVSFLDLLSLWETCVLPSSPGTQVPLKEILIWPFSPPYESGGRPGEETFPPMRVPLPPLYLLPRLLLSQRDISSKKMRCCFFCAHRTSSLQSSFDPAMFRGAASFKRCLIDVLLGARLPLPPSTESLLKVFQRSFTPFRVLSYRKLPSVNNHLLPSYSTFLFAPSNRLNAG